MPPAMSAVVVMSVALLVKILIQAALPTAMPPVVSAVVVMSVALLVLVKIQAASLTALPRAVQAVVVISVGLLVQIVQLPSITPTTLTPIIKMALAHLIPMVSRLLFSL